MGYATHGKLVCVPWVEGVDQKAALTLSSKTLPKKLGCVISPRTICKHEGNTHKQQVVVGSWAAATYLDVQVLDQASLVKMAHHTPNADLVAVVSD